MYDCRSNTPHKITETVTTPKQGTTEARASFITWWRHQMETFSALLALCVVKSPVNSAHKGRWRGALMFSLICARIIDWVNNREAGDLRRQRAHYDVIVMIYHTVYRYRTMISLRYKYSSMVTLKQIGRHFHLIFSSAFSWKKIYVVWFKFSRMFMI